MATRITEEELAAHGIIAGPNGKAVILTDKDAPDESWSKSQLAVFYHKCEQVAVGYGKAESAERYIQGHAVHLAHNKCKNDGTPWGDWCKESQINRQTAYRSELLYVRAQKKWGEEALKEVSLRTTTELYVMFGILRRPIPKPRETTEETQGEQKSNTSKTPGNSAAPTTEVDGTDDTSIEAEDDTEDDSESDDEYESEIENESETNEAEDTQANDQAPSKRKKDYSFSPDALATVTLKEPDLYEVQLEDADNGEITILVYRKLIENIYGQIEKAMDEDDECDPDPIPECGNEPAERNGQHDAGADSFTR